MRGDAMLAIETSSLRGSVALGRGEQVLAWRTLSAERRHTTELLPAIQELLAGVGVRPGQVAVVCFSQGPGSFTGLRVAATVARMWQSATGCRVVAVPTLEVIARNALGAPRAENIRATGDAPYSTAGTGPGRYGTAGTEPARDSAGGGRLAVMVDARRGQVFGAVFARVAADELRTLAEAALHDAMTWLASLEKPCQVLGEAVKQYQAAALAAGLEILPEEYWWPDARQVLAVGRRLADAGQFCAPAQIVPLYLRPPECEEVYDQRRAEARQRRGEGA